VRVSVASDRMARGCNLPGQFGLDLDVLSRHPTVSRPPRRLLRARTNRPTTRAR
jgi:hypothetical protein